MNGFFDIEKISKNPFPPKDPLDIEERDRDIISDFLEKKLKIFQKNDCEYIQGQDKCPVCKGVVNYTWCQLSGFSVYECSTNNCLPFLKMESMNSGR